ncbi:hypothetical protein [Meiothermus ruber]|uniref:hypothetical protein n=1 Tax=Meiothermus ruber TaxID=277 RepID=UPI001FCBD3E5|nr:hypothetical protein [Meiothermus ruber]
MRRLQSTPGVYCERVIEKGRPVLLFDPSSIEQIWGPPIHPLPQPDLEPAPEIILPTPTTALQAEPTSDSVIPSALADRPVLPDLRQADPDDLALWERIEQLRRRLAQIPRGERTQTIAAFARAEGVSAKTAYNWLKMSARHFFARRADAGSLHIPTELLEAVISLWLHHPQASAWMIHRWLQVANPDILIYNSSCHLS